MSSKELWRDLFKYLLWYLETPKHERKAARLSGRRKDAALSRWFGLMPLAISIGWRSLTRRRHDK